MEALYERYRRAVREERYPLAAVDLDALDENVAHLSAVVAEGGKRMRLATKSVRCPSLIRHIVDEFGPHAKGLMSFAVLEAELLVEEGFDDIFVAYPTGDRKDAERLARLNASGRTVSITCDSIEHFELLDPAARAVGTRIPVVLEVDLSYRPLGGALHVGARRSPLLGADALLALAEKVERYAGLELHGVMGYEAQIAGLPDQNPFSPLLNGPKRIIKSLSRGPVEETRARIAEGLSARGIGYEIFNGGGSGSLAWCTRESALTEVTAGSGFLDSHLFDYFQDLSVRPAAFFGLQVVRHPAPAMVTCHGGGYIASGEAGPDRAPVPWLPSGLSLVRFEGAGEVQTPLRLPERLVLPLGAPVFFRHAKSGELAEHFTEYLLIRRDQIVDRVPTYRGLGLRFL